MKLFFSRYVAVARNCVQQNSHPHFIIINLSQNQFKPARELGASLF
jgi:hypothetical protein